MLTYLRSTLTVFAKDFRVWPRQPITIAACILPSLILLLVQAHAAVTVGRSPVALVNEDKGPAGAKLVTAHENADVFRLTEVSHARGLELLSNICVVAVVTIPAGFSEAVAASRPVAVEVRVNNLNLDFTNDIRRSVPDAITRYYAAMGSASPIHVSIAEMDIRSRDIELFQYSVVPAGVFWLSSLLIIALISLLGSSLGVALGSGIRRIQPMIVLSILLTLYLFFLSGGLGALAFEPPWLQQVAAFVPLTYGIHALQMALFYNSADFLWRDVLVLVAVSGLMVAAGTLAMKR